MYNAMTPLSCSKRRCQPYTGFHLLRLANRQRLTANTAFGGRSSGIGVNVVAVGGEWTSGLPADAGLSGWARRVSDISRHTFAFSGYINIAFKLSVFCVTCSTNSRVTLALCLLTLEVRYTPLGR